MSDFDFDEIDKAVNTALGTTPATTNPAPAPTPKVKPEEAKQVDEPPVIPPVADKPVAPVTPAPIATPASAVAPATPVTPQPSTAPATRRPSGRFMDMVHPSSDMRTATQASTPTPEDTSPIPTITLESITPVATPSSKVESEPVAAASLEPSFEFELEEDDWAKPLESPFIPDAKVEKRPLGGEAPTATQFDASELLEAPDDPRIEAHAMPDPIDFSEQKAAEQQALPEPEEIPLPDLKIHQEPEQPSAPQKEEGGYGVGSFQPLASSPGEPVGPASIAQQYTEKPAEEGETGAIYDTEAYHQPLTHAPKKNSGVWVVLWVTLLVLLGGGAGAAVYFFVLPLL